MVSSVPLATPGRQVERALALVALGYSREGAAASIGLAGHTLWRLAGQSRWRDTLARRRETLRLALDPDLACECGSAKWVDERACTRCLPSVPAPPRPCTMLDCPRPAAPRARRCWPCRHAAERARRAERFGTCCDPGGYVPMSHRRCAPPDEPLHRDRLDYCGILAGARHLTQDRDLDRDGRCPACARWSA